jgi:lipid-binding SYLF domain-containing protein
MTQEALADFRGSDGWAVGADAEYVFNDQGQTVGVETTTALAPVIAVVYGQSGLIVGATLEGTKYTRIIR